MKNTGLEYEVLVQSIFQEMHDQEAVTNISVQRDVLLSGKSGVSHQIDVYWEFEHAGIKYQTIVQAKDWNSRVKKEQVLTFKAVLEDLPGQPRGLIVTNAGYQSGAKTYAKNHGIELFQVQELGEEVRITFDKIFQLGFASFANMTVKLNPGRLEVVHYKVSFSRLDIRLSEKWKAKKVKAFGERIATEAFAQVPGINDRLFDTKFEPVENIAEVILNESSAFQEKAKATLVSSDVFRSAWKHQFSRPRYYRARSNAIPFVRVERISGEIEVTLGEQYEIPFIKTGIASFVLKNILSGTEKKVSVTLASAGTEKKEN